MSETPFDESLAETEYSRCGSIGFGVPIERIESHPDDVATTVNDTPFNKNKRTDTARTSPSHSSDAVRASYKTKSMLAAQKAWEEQRQAVKPEEDIWWEQRGARACSAAALAAVSPKKLSSTPSKLLKPTEAYLNSTREKVPVEDLIPIKVSVSPSLGSKHAGSTSPNITNSITGFKVKETSERLLKPYPIFEATKPVANHHRVWEDEIGADKAVGWKAHVLKDSLEKMYESNIAALPVHSTPAYIAAAVAATDSRERLHKPTAAFLHSTRNKVSMENSPPTKVSMTVSSGFSVDAGGLEPRTATASPSCPRERAGTSNSIVDPLSPASITPEIPMHVLKVKETSARLLQPYPIFESTKPTIVRRHNRHQKVSNIDTAIDIPGETKEKDTSWNIYGKTEPMEKLYKSSSPISPYPKKASPSKLLHPTSVCLHSSHDKTVATVSPSHSPVQSSLTHAREDNTAKPSASPTKVRETSNPTYKKSKSQRSIHSSALLANADDATLKPKVKKVMAMKVNLKKGAVIESARRVDKVEKDERVENHERDERVENHERDESDTSTAVTIATIAVSDKNAPLESSPTSIADVEVLDTFPSCMGIDGTIRVPDSDDDTTAFTDDIDDVGVIFHATKKYMGELERLRTANVVLGIEGPLENQPSTRHEQS